MRKIEDIIVNINENDYSFSFDKDFPEEVYIGDKEYTVKVLKDYGNGVFAYSINNKNMLVQVDSQNGNYKILHNNFLYEAGVKTSTSAVLEQYVSASSADDQNPILKAPMPGMVIKILCKLGDQVQKDDKLVIVEAMKMENTLTSPATGKVVAIRAVEGEAVDKDDVLIELETEVE